TDDEIYATRENGEITAMPSCTATANNYYVKTGRDLSEASEEEIVSSISQQMSDGDVVEIRFSADTYEQRIHYIFDDDSSYGEALYWKTPDSVLEEWTQYYYIQDDDVYVVTMYI
ncbi:MAG: hypothetical protein IJU16_07630, partial [Clostridia bacterium]|nr:hypothetical protein [Clostridia bacterium]